ncbi:MAG: phosphoglucosamine mutase [Crocinitomicaceae bacterium]|nr:phosphoglucosamine mutase [Crocinitomicaceae bacterium]|tara:strand:+ start:5357 stop:6772 length:1416 start_codon:yes stop_codon:yes gene_type:complete
MSNIKFGTDGWRAIIAKDFTVANVSRVAYATAEWTIKNFNNPSIVIGHDCRFGGELFVETAVKVFASKGIKVYLAKTFISTPMISLGVKKLKASVGVVVTASHNPPEYNGYKLKGYFGGPLSTEKVEEVESLIPTEDKIYLNHINIENQIEKGNIKEVDLEKMYIERVQSSFDLEAIRNSGLNFAYDAMYGAGQNVMKKLFPQMTFLHCDFNPSFLGQAPEPIDKNLQEFSHLIKERKNIAAGLATDGDADRIGLYNSKGEFVDSHHIILLLLLYLHKYKKMTGKVVVAASTTPRVTKLAELWGLDHDTVKVGFKYIASQMINEDVLIGGEESGGIAIKGHIPERDGIWMGLVLFEYMAKSGKTLDELVLEVYDLVGEFKYCRDDLHISDELKNSIVKKCNQDEFTSFGEYNVESIDKTDGFKFILNDSQWLMIRPSGTEPVLRCYAESETLLGARAILNACKSTIGINKS